MTSATASVSLGAELPLRDERQQQLRTLLDDLLRTIQQSLGDTLHAVLLSGSLGRGEAIAVTTDDGDWLLLSDIDLYVVSTGAVPLSLREALRQRLRGAQFLPAGADVAFVPPAHFASLGPTLPAAQLRSSLRTLFLAPQAEWSGPDHEQVVVDADDALALIQNRAGELLYVRERANAAHGAVLLAYRELRLAVDSGLAFLSAGAPYEPDRKIRDAALQHLLSEVESGAELAAEWQRLRELQRLASSGALRSRELCAAFRSGGLESKHRRWTRTLSTAILARRHSGAALSLQQGAATPVADWGQLADRWLKRRGRLATLREARRWAPLAPSARGSWWRYGSGGTGPERVRWACLELLCGRGEAAAAQLVRPLLTGSLRGQACDAALAQLWSEWMLGGRRL